MQTLFAFYQGSRSNLEIAWTELRDGTRGLLDVHPQWADSLKATLDQHLKSPQAALPADLPPELAEAIEMAKVTFNEKLSADLKYLRKSMMAEVEGVHGLYLWVLSLPLALRDLESQLVNKKQLTPGKGHPRYLIDNKGLQLLEERLKGMSLPSWNQHMDRLSQWYKELKQHIEVHGALAIKEQGLDRDVQFLRFLFKSVLWKSSSLQDFFEEHDMGWSENQDIIKSLVNKTLKSIHEQGVELAPLSYQWEDDKRFFEDIFDHTVNNDHLVKELIAGNAKNWDLDRIAQVDMILLKMALTEMIKFPSIPVKVTINEYIEMSKKYSTPKSKKFINGILDVLAGELTADGTIKKSGRGLIDNK